MYILLKYFTFAAANGEEFLSEWMRIAEVHQNWQLVVLVHSGISTSAGGLQLQTTWDTGLEEDVSGATTNLATRGISRVEITQGVGPMVRVQLTATADTVVTISVYLTPKSE
jgi:hypothetical protein